MLSGSLKQKQADFNVFQKRKKGKDILYLIIWTKSITQVPGALPKWE